MSGPGYCGCCGSDTTHRCGDCNSSLGGPSHACRCDEPCPNPLPMTEQEVAWRVDAAARAFPTSTLAMGAEAWKRSKGR